MTGESLGLLERFAAWKTLGGVRIDEMPARDAEALMILEREWRSEREHGDQ